MPKFMVYEYKFTSAMFDDVIHFRDGKSYADSTYYSIVLGVVGHELDRCDDSTGSQTALMGICGKQRSKCILHTCILSLPAIKGL
jgi:hypothetical protein